MLKLKGMVYGMRATVTQGLPLLSNTFIEGTFGTSYEQMPSVWIVALPVVEMAATVTGLKSFSYTALLR